MNPIADRIRDAINAGLPGTGVQWEMASSDRMIRDFPRVKKAGSKMAAVLILLYPGNKSISTFFIQRPVYNGVHSGQVSFPGGKAEPGDRDLLHTALREAAEEAGINPDSVTILGVLTPLYIHVSDTEVTPVVGWTDQKPDFLIDPAEVIHVIESGLDSIANPAIIKEMQLTVRGKIINVRHYDLSGAVVWGATAMILHELITIFRREQIPFIL